MRESERASARRRTLVVEGWRFIPHSFAVINQWLCLALLRRQDLRLRVRDLPYWRPDWTATTGLFDDVDEEQLRRIPMAAADEAAEVTLRLVFPYDFQPAAGGRSFVFGTSEFGCVPSHYFQAIGSLREARCHVITSSHWSARGFFHSGMSPDQVTTVPLGTDTGIFRPSSNGRRAGRARLGLTGFAFLAVGGMHANKGIDLVLRSFAEVAKRQPDVQLILKGTDALYASLDSVNAHLAGLPVADQELVRSRLIYIGDTYSMRQMAELYQCADAYVSPYRAEGFNMPVLEAAACGLPVVCSAGGPTDDFTHPDFALPISTRTVSCSFGDAVGVMLEPSLEHLIDLMQRVATDDVWCRQAAKAGPAFVGAGYTWDHMAQRLMDAMFGP